MPTTSDLEATIARLEAECAALEAGNRKAARKLAAEDRRNDRVRPVRGSK